MFALAKKYPGRSASLFVAVAVGGIIYMNQRGVEKNRCSLQFLASDVNGLENTVSELKNVVSNLAKTVNENKKESDANFKALGDKLTSHEIAISQLLREAAMDRQSLKRQLESIQNQLVFAELVQIKKSVAPAKDHVQTDSSLD